MVEPAISALIAEGSTSPTADQIAAKAAELQAAAEAARAALNPPPDPAVIEAGRQRAQAVDTWLANLRDTDPDQFEAVRRLSFEEQAKRAGV